MSRSRKKRAISGITTAESEKWDKIFAHRKFRKTSKRYLKSGDFDRLPHRMQEISDNWMFEKDGKIDWDHLASDSFWNTFAEEKLRLKQFAERIKRK